MLKLPGMTLRPAIGDDLAQVVHLNRLAFAPLQSDADLVADWYGGTLERPGRSLWLAVETQTGEAVGTYGQLDLRLWLGGQLLPAMGISGVAVALHRRGQKIAGMMLDHALKQAREQAIPLVMLYPFQQGFYRKLGWAWVGQTHQYRVSSRDLPLYPERRQMSPWQEPINLATVYEQAASQHNGWLQRRDWQWQAYLKPGSGREIYCYRHQERTEGYVMVQFVAPSTTHPAAVIVREWVCLTPAAYRGILGFLASLRDQVSTIIWNTFAEDPFAHLLREQRQDPAVPATVFEFGLVHRLGAIASGFMWRLVDLEQAVSHRSVQPTDPFQVTLQVLDPILGDRRLSLDFSGSTMQITSQPAPTVITLSIEHLTVLFSGMRRASDLFWTGELDLEGDRAVLSRLDTAWQITPPFCWDFF